MPLFPLQTVLFPGGPLPLRVFETRYLDMVSRCMREDGEFGVVLILAGTETGETRPTSIGTLARITDWYQGSDGILGITAQGGQRFRLNGITQQPDRLNIGEIELLEDEPRVELPAEYRPMATLLEGIIEDLGKLYESLAKDYDDASWVGCRFAEILPMAMEQKQQCLEMSDPLERLAFVRPMLRAVRQEPSQ